MQEAAEIRASGVFLPPVIPEGGFLTRAVASLERREDLGVWSVRLRDRINGAPNRLVTLLPSPALGDMIDAHRAATAAGETALFEVTGRVLAWRGSNFLLLSYALPVRALAAPASDEAPLVPPGAGVEAGAAETPAAAAAQPAPSAPAPPAAAGPAAAAPSAPVAAPSAPAPAAAAPSTAASDPENVGLALERALDARVTSVVRSPDAQAATPAPPGTAQPSRAVQPADSALTGALRDPAPSAPLGPDGMPLAAGVAERAAAVASDAPLAPQRLLDRRGTVTRDPMTGTWIFVLASGHVSEGDHAMELLPCAALDRLVAMVRSSPQAMPVVLTGEVTVFEGRNYIRPIRARTLREGRWLGP